MSLGCPFSHHSSLIPLFVCHAHPLPLSSPFVLRAILIHYFIFPSFNHNTQIPSLPLVHVSCSPPVLYFPPPFVCYMCALLIHSSSVPSRVCNAHTHTHTHTQYPLFMCHAHLPLLTFPPLCACRTTYLTTCRILQSKSADCILCAGLPTLLH